MPIELVEFLETFIKILIHLLEDVNINELIYADFNSRNEDNVVRMYQPFTTLNNKKIDLELFEGENLWLSDGEVEMRGVLTFREGIWVVVPDENGFKYVEK